MCRNAVALFLGCATIHYWTRIPSATYKNGHQVNLFLNSCVFIHSSGALDQVSWPLKAALTAPHPIVQRQLVLSVSLVHADGILSPAHPASKTYLTCQSARPCPSRPFSDSRSKLRSRQSSLPSPRLRKHKVVKSGIFLETSREEMTPSQPCNAIYGHRTLQTRKSENNDKGNA